MYGREHEAVESSDSGKQQRSRQAGFAQPFDFPSKYTGGD
jgi:hypothetical protein